jgi:hypothetical protein
MRISICSRSNIADEEWEDKLPENERDDWDEGQPSEQQYGSGEP